MGMKLLGLVRKALGYYIIGRSLTQSAFESQNLFSLHPMLKVAWSDFWVTMPFNFVWLEKHHYQSKKKINITARERWKFQISSYDIQPNVSKSHMERFLWDFRNNFLKSEIPTLYFQNYPWWQVIQSYAKWGMASFHCYHGNWSDLYK